MSPEAIQVINIIFGLFIALASYFLKEVLTTLKAHSLTLNELKVHKAATEELFKEIKKKITTFDDHILDFYKEHNHNLEFLGRNHSTLEIIINNHKKAG